MWIRILRQTSISGQPARVGDVIDVNNQDASTLIAMRKAEVAQDPSPVVIAQGKEAKPPRTRKPRPS